jgi:DNA-binding CsgD family transcriptional regulator
MKIVRRNPARERIIDLFSKYNDLVQVAKEVGSSPHSIQRTLRRAGIKTSLKPNVKARHEAVKELHAQGMHTKEIAVRLGVKLWQVDASLNTLQLTPHKWGPCGKNKKGQLLYPCRKCGGKKPRDGFPTSIQAKTGKPVQHRVCTDCRTADRREYYYQGNWFVRHFHTTRSRCKRSGIVFTLPEGFLEEVFAKQGGKCFYTDEPMVSNTGKGRKSDHSITIDKVVPEGGYIPGNVVLCSELANRVKSNLSLSQIAAWLPGWFDRIMTFTGEDFAQVKVA